MPYNNKIKRYFPGRLNRFENVFILEILNGGTVKFKCQILSKELIEKTQFISSENKSIWGKVPINVSVN